MLDSSKLKEFADENSKSHEDVLKFSKWLENIVGKKRNCPLRAISPLPTVCTADTLNLRLVWERVKPFFGAFS